MGLEVLFLIGLKVILKTENNLLDINHVILNTEMLMWCPSGIHFGSTVVCSVCKWCTNTTSLFEIILFADDTTLSYSHSNISLKKTKTNKNNQKNKTKQIKTKKKQKTKQYIYENDNKVTKDIKLLNMV